ncbi:MAG: molybdate transport system substrate-binding protein [Campylobacterota bacterium]|nr:molybdate transport system substrate-binding protein [Campylobacterota bacterium]MDQ1338967.1 molybdate transport system substrate-binding protein [Campylobacterota bacterium]
MKKLFYIFLLSSLSLFAGEINIAVAANVGYAMDELKEEFKKSYPNTRVIVTLGSSGKLTAQIKNGAPYGIFMSADMEYPEALYNEGLAVAKPIIYANGALAYLSSKKLDFSKGIKILNGKDISKIAIANPKTAPYGAAAIEAIKKSGIYEEIKGNFVYGESISQAVSYAVTAADVGLVPKSSLYGDKMIKYKEGINWTSVDEKLYSPIEQGLVILKNTQNNAEYKAFYDFILSQKAKEIFKRYGYIVK